MFGFLFNITFMNLPRVYERVHANLLSRALFHSLFWFFLFLAQLHFATVSFNLYKGFSYAPLLARLACDTTNLAICFYFLAYLVFPLFFFRGKAAIGLALLFLTVIIYTFLQAAIEEIVIKRCASCMQQLALRQVEYNRFLQQSLYARAIDKFESLGILTELFFYLCIPASLKFAFVSIRQREQSTRLAAQKAKLELNFLKAQVNPHFLFNSLNNVYGLIVTGEREKSAMTVARLSQFMRYSVYEISKEKVPLESEVQLLRSYIELETIRLNHIQVKFHCQLDSPNLPIAPLLLMPLIENAFKYSPDTASAVIYIHLQNTGRLLDVIVENTVDPERLPQNIPGTGLQNLKKRLEHYYKGCYHFCATYTKPLYRTNLRIKQL